ncbi:unnamed protein product [Amoebophrya sp. A25]|nr:unnamed protein product [Amoebophrya sp. A25]|eukprot:GSA25T00004397001.1
MRLQLAISLASAVEGSVPTPGTTGAASSVSGPGGLGLLSPARTRTTSTEASTASTTKSDEAADHEFRSRQTETSSGLQSDHAPASSAASGCATSDDNHQGLGESSESSTSGPANSSAGPSDNSTWRSTFWEVVEGMTSDFRALACCGTCVTGRTKRDSADAAAQRAYAKQLIAQRAAKRALLEPREAADAAGTAGEDSGCLGSSFVAGRSCGSATVSREEVGLCSLTTPVSCGGIANTLACVSTRPSTSGSTAQLRPFQGVGRMLKDHVSSPDAASDAEAATGELPAQTMDQRASSSAGSSFSDRGSHSASASSSDTQ